MKRLMAPVLVLFFTALTSACVAGEPNHSETFDLLLVPTSQVFTARATLLVQSNLTLSGTVTDAGGNPLDNALVAPAIVFQANGQTPSEAFTDAAGAWQLTVTPRTSNIIVTVFVTRNGQSVGTFLWNIVVVPEVPLATVEVSTTEGTAILNTTAAVSAK